MNTIRYAVLALTVALGLGAAQPADAALLFVGNGSGVCRAASGLGTNFYFGALGVKNISASTQLMSCNLPLLRERTETFPLLPTGYALVLYFGTYTTVTRTVTCTATVAYAGQSLATRSTSTKSVALTALKGSGTISFSRTDLRIKDLYAPLNLSCSVPTNVVFGRFDQYQPELAQAGV